MALLIVLGGPGTAGAAEVPLELDFDPARGWVDTEVDVDAGAGLVVDAEGIVSLGPDPIDAMVPQGEERGPSCQAVAGPDAVWPAPELRCWALIARIGDGPAFALEPGEPVPIPATGRLWLGINDTYLADNVGIWSVRVDVRPGGAAPGTATGTTDPAGPDAGAGAGTSDTDAAFEVLLVLLAATVGVAAIVGVAVRARRRRARGEAAPALPPSLYVARVPVSISGGRIVRFGADGFTLARSDFEPFDATTQGARVTWRGLELTSVRRSRPFGSPSVRITLPGGFVAGSDGVILLPDGHTAGRIRAEVAGTWAFVLPPEPDAPSGADEPSAVGEVVAFVRGDRAFTRQRDGIVSSLDRFRGRLEPLLQRRAARTAQVGADDLTPRPART
jgi:hypothetical protein